MPVVDRIRHFQHPLECDLAGFPVDACLHLEVLTVLSQRRYLHGFFHGAQHHVGIDQALVGDGLGKLE